jgi:hypothetical protein
VLSVGTCKDVIAQVRGQLKVRAVATYSQLQNPVTDFGTSTACLKIKFPIQINACSQMRPIGHKAWHHFGFALDTKE